MQRRSTPVAWHPKGLSDVLDATGSFPGAMASLQNLIPDPSTPTLWQCRPASILVTNFQGPFSSGFSAGFAGGFQAPSPGSTGGISALFILGNIAYGMAASGNIPGHDAPFAFNLMTNTLITIGGSIVAATTPATLAATGDWVPPQMDVVGSKVVVCHSGFSGAGNVFFGWIDISNPAAPVWNAGNFAYRNGGTGPILFQFSVPPIAIQQFNGRAYFIHNLLAQPAVVFSDINDPTQNTGTVTPILTFGDNDALTAIAGLPLTNQVIGGVVQSLIVFKNVVGMFQITGDASNNSLAINSLNVQTGTFAANGIASTPRGLAFIAPDGLRMVDFQARVSDPIGIDGKGVNVPFQLIVFPTRSQLSCNANVLRISLNNGNLPGAPTQEYWYDFARGIFHGPHTFPASMIQPWNNTFIMQPTAFPGTLYRSDTVQSLTSTFVEAGQQMTWKFNTSYLPSTETVTNNCMTEGTLDLSLAPGVPPINIAAANPQGSIIDNIAISGQAGATIWGGFLWGGSVWGGVSSQLAPRQLQWHLPLVFTKVQLQVSGQSALAQKIGRFELRYQGLRQWTDITAAA